MEFDTGGFININCADVDSGDVGEAIATKLWQHAAFEVLAHERIDAANFRHYWLSFKHDNSNSNGATDLHAFGAARFPYYRCISILPITRVSKLLD